MKAKDSKVMIYLLNAIRFLGSMIRIHNITKNKINKKLRRNRKKKKKTRNRIKIRNKIKQNLSRIKISHKN